jgi:UDP-N-acetyl-D-mannosaminuronic acid dehydrogenase
MGYIGFPTALLFARAGHRVTGVDIQPSLVADLQAGRIAQRYPEMLPWWEAFQAQPEAATQLHVTTGPPPPADVFILAVPTPVDAHTHACDLSAVQAAAASIRDVLRPGNLVILESTVPPGTTRDVVAPLLAQSGLRVGPDVHLCFMPERVLPGNLCHELVHNHRLIGGLTPEAAQRAQALLRPLLAGELHLTDDKTAEFCKLAENTYRDVNIALANELAIVAQAQGIDITEARALINQHPRVEVLRPGIGVGGHCIAVDPWFFVQLAPQHTRLIRAAREVNDAMPAWRTQQILADVADLAQLPGGPKVCVYGLTYKPNVPDTRESPALHILRQLGEAGVKVCAFDPLLPEYQQVSFYDVAHGTDYLAVLVPHQHWWDVWSLNASTLKSLMRTPRVRIFG